MSTLEAPEAERATRVAARARGATKIYGGGAGEVRALDGVDVDFEAGRFTAIMGPSGSGKSTLMHCLAGLDVLTEGEAWLGDIELTGLSERERTKVRRDRVGFVFQAFNLIPTLTARENVELPSRIARRRPDKQWTREVVGALGLADRMSHRPTELSGGQQQRVAVARALATRPEAIFADEPTGALDSRSGAALLDFLRRAVREMEQTVVMVTHDPNAASYADRVVFLGDGRIDGEIVGPTAEAVLDRMKTIGGPA